jgi:hypothetical protein
MDQDSGRVCVVALGIESSEELRPIIELGRALLRSRQQDTTFVSTAAHYDVQSAALAELTICRLAQRVSVLTDAKFAPQLHDHGLAFFDIGLWCCPGRANLPETARLIRFARAP